jgi:hypothetical protein
LLWDSAGIVWAPLGFQGQKQEQTATPAAAKKGAHGRGVLGGRDGRGRAWSRSDSRRWQEGPRRMENGGSRHWVRSVGQIVCLSVPDRMVGRSLRGVVVQMLERERERERERNNNERVCSTLRID